MKHQNEFPNVLLDTIYWSFKEQSPYSPTSMLQAVRNYHENLNTPFDLELFSSTSPFITMEIQYNFSIEIPGASPSYDVTWDDKMEVIVIDGKGQFLKYVDILSLLHTNVHNNLKNQDHHYLEGLYYVQLSNKGIPVYELYLGS